MGLESLQRCGRSRRLNDHRHHVFEIGFGRQLSKDEEGSQETTQLPSSIHSLIRPIIICMRAFVCSSDAFSTISPQMTENRSI